MNPPTLTEHLPIERVGEVYVGVFPITLPGESVQAETILAGYQRDPDYPGQDRVRATVETHASAVPDLIDMCASIVAQQKEIDSFRLLKFDRNGVHELDPRNFRDQYAFAAGTGSAASRSRVC
ncbi:MAG: hypothetical protein R6X08_02070 [Desulfosalsimonadaceae bacterium]